MKLIWMLIRRPSLLRKVILNHRFGRWGVRATALAGALVLTAVYAAGNSAAVSWIAPITYNEGSVLPATDIASYTVSWTGIAGPQGAGPAGSLVVKAPATNVSIPVACGTVNFSVSVTTTAGAKYPSATSDPAGPIAYASGLECKPNPPGAPAAR